MSNKPEEWWVVALWDAGAFEREDAEFVDAELRRLYSVNQALLEALRGMLALDDEHHQRGHCDDDVCTEIRKAREAIAKATGSEA